MSRPLPVTNAYVFILPISCLFIEPMGNCGCQKFPGRVLMYVAWMIESCTAKALSFPGFVMILDSTYIPSLSLVYMQMSFCFSLTAAWQKGEVSDVLSFSY